MLSCDKLPTDEEHAFQYADQYVGCVSCKKSNHETSFCQKCGQCFFCLMGGDKTLPKEKKRVIHGEYTIVCCPCGAEILWD